MHSATIIIVDLEERVEM